MGSSPSGNPPLHINIYCMLLMCLQVVNKRSLSLLSYITRLIQTELLTYHSEFKSEFETVIFLGVSTTAGRVTMGFWNYKVPCLKTLSSVNTGWLIGWLVLILALSAQTGYIVAQQYEIYCSGPGTIFPSPQQYISTQ